jgi:hypothetical protein
MKVSSISPLSLALGSGLAAGPKAGLSVFLARIIPLPSRGFSCPAFVRVSEALRKFGYDRSRFVNKLSPFAPITLSNAQGVNAARADC